MFELLFLKKVKDETRVGLLYLVNNQNSLQKDLKVVINLIILFIIFKYEEQRPQRTW